MLMVQSPVKVMSVMGSLWTKNVFSWSREDSVVQQEVQDPRRWSDPGVRLGQGLVDVGKSYRPWARWGFKTDQWGEELEQGWVQEEKGLVDWGWIYH